MESRPDLTRARELFGSAFLGPYELQAIATKIGVAPPGLGGTPVPLIPFAEARLAALAPTHLLILGSTLSPVGEPLTINLMRRFWGVDPEERQPCFYNQDWYLNEGFAQRAGLENRWYILRRDVPDETRGRDPDELMLEFAVDERHPTALLASYAFFAYSVHSGGERLWRHSFIWCSDTDHNGDRIYVGRYEDPDRVNRDGFNIHRHLRIRRAYGAATEIVPG